LFFILSVGAPGSVQTSNSVIFLPAFRRGTVGLTGGPGEEDSLCLWTLFGTLLRDHTPCYGFRD
jgi:hypothetical protein